MARRIDRQELADVIRNLQGVTDEQKSALLELLNEKKKYGLVWENHQEDAEDKLREEIPVLKEVTDRRIISEDKDAPNHIIIEGDNLHALTSLCYTHEGKIDVIYIDPPYNTGNKDFVYNDSFVDAEDGYRHSKWLSFMEKRLRIAHRLLSDKGVIFISIDDNEQANLKLLCDEVFGENKYLNHISWISNITGRQISGTGAAKTWESILVYTKKMDEPFPLYVDINFAKNNMPDAYKGFKKDIRIDAIGEYAIGDTLYNHNRKFNEETRPNLVYSLFYNPHTEDIITGDIGDEYSGYVEILPHENGDGTHKYHAWRWSRKKVNEEKYDLIVLTTARGEYEVHTRIRKFDKTTLKDIITNIPNGDAELQTILGTKKFDYPKSVDLVKTLLASIDNKDFTVIDFFAGSGTTMHATMQLNAEDGGHRQCILVTNNENNICEEVTYERNRRVINGYTTPKGVEVEGLHNNNLRYYRTEFVPREKSNANKRSLVYAATDLLCIKENIYDEAAVTIQGRTVRKEFVRRFVDGDREMMVIYEPRVISRIVEELKLREVKSPINVYVFCDGQYAYTDDFRDVLDKVNLCAFPDAIYQAYNKVLPPRKPQEDFAVEASEEEIREALIDADNYSYKSDEAEEL